MTTAVVCAGAAGRRSALGRGGWRRVGAGARRQLGERGKLDRHLLEKRGAILKNVTALLFVILGMLGAFAGFVRSMTVDGRALGNLYGHPVIHIPKFGIQKQKGLRRDDVTP
ncbi:hypothetical protein GCM10007242_40010 [Pigmentiphaga litoralis]|nr:hypothetical protein GCM10007242_40010 [Pigmentiphaga litoralis]